MERRGCTLCVLSWNGTPRVYTMRFELDCVCVCVWSVGLCLSLCRFELDCVRMRADCERMSARSFCGHAYVLYFTLRLLIGKQLTCCSFHSNNFCHDHALAESAMFGDLLDIASNKRYCLFVVLAQHVQYAWLFA